MSLIINLLKPKFIINIIGGAKEKIKNFSIFDYIFSFGAILTFIGLCLLLKLTRKFGFNPITTPYGIHPFLFLLFFIIFLFFAIVLYVKHNINENDNNILKENNKINKFFSLKILQGKVFIKNSEKLFDEKLINKMDNLKKSTIFSLYGLGLYLFLFLLSFLYIGFLGYPHLFIFPEIAAISSHFEIILKRLFGVFAFIFQIYTFSIIVGLIFRLIANGFKILKIFFATDTNKVVEKIVSGNKSLNKKEKELLRSYMLNEIFEIDEKEKKSKKKKISKKNKETDKSKTKTEKRKKTVKNTKTEETVKTK